MTAILRREVHRLSSQHRDGSLMYPGQSVLTWVKPSSALPWVLTAIERVAPAAEPKGGAHADA